MNDPTIPAPPPAFTAEDFARVGELLDNASRTDFRAIAPYNRNPQIILAALRLAPVGLAAVAYHDRAREPYDLNKTHDSWKALHEAATEYRKHAAPARNEGEG